MASNLAGSPRNGDTRALNRSWAQPSASDAELAMLEALERLLATVPLHQIRVEEIVKAADVSRTTFYYHFSSKWALLAARLTQTIEEISLVTQPVFEEESSEPPAVVLRRGLEQSTALWAEHRSILHATMENWQVVPEAREVWLNVASTFTNAIADWIDRQRQYGQAPPGPDSRSLAAFLFWSGAQCLYVAGLELDDAVLTSREDVVDVLLASWLGAIYHPAGPSFP